MRLPSPDLEKCSLCFSVLAQFEQVITQTAFRFVLRALIFALGFIPLFLLSRLFFLAFGKRGSASWHSQVSSVLKKVVRITSAARGAGVRDDRRGLVRLLHRQNGARRREGDRLSAWLR
jgi:hypothetical protein